MSLFTQYENITDAVLHRQVPTGEVLKNTVTCPSLSVAETCRCHRIQQKPAGVLEIQQKPAGVIEIQQKPADAIEYSRNLQVS
jgi:hypothetical protein